MSEFKRWCALILMGLTVMIAACTAPSPQTEWKLVEPGQPGAASAQAPLLVVYRSEAGAARQPAVNVYLNGDYQASLLPGAWTQVEGCDGTNMLQVSKGDAQRGYADKLRPGSAWQLAPARVYYWSVETDTDGRARLRSVAPERAQVELRGLPQQAHTISRVRPSSCPPPERPVAATPVAMTTTPTVPVRYVLSASALFRFGGGGAAEMVPGGRAAIEQLAREITQAHARIDRIVVSGHTDPEGGEAYNRQLSAARAYTVAQLLTQAGLAANVIRHQGLAASELVIGACHQKDTQVRRACNQPNRRVEVSVEGLRR